MPRSTQILLTYSTVYQIPIDPQLANELFPAHDTYSTVQYST